MARLSTAVVTNNYNGTVTINGVLAATANAALCANYATSANLLDGQHGAFYQDATNINAGTLSLARLSSAVLTSDYTGGVSINGTLTTNRAIIGRGSDCPGRRVS